MEPLFDKHYDQMMRPLESNRLGRIRRQLLSKARGKVLEIGSGTGANFMYYGQDAASVIAIEPNPAMLRQSLPRASAASVPVEVMQGDAQSLPFANDSFDTVVGTLVLCTIPDPLKALSEVRRVCKPEGTVLFLEHVRLDHPVLGKLQDWLTPASKRLCAGCHLNRNAVEFVRDAGFNIEQTEWMYKKFLVAIKATI